MSGIGMDSGAIGTEFALPPDPDDVIRNNVDSFTGPYPSYEAPQAARNEIAKIKQSRIEIRFLVNITFFILIPPFY